MDFPEWVHVKEKTIYISGQGIFMDIAQISSGIPVCIFLGYIFYHIQYTNTFHLVILVILVQCDRYQAI